MTKREAYAAGFDNGRQAALYCEPSSLTDGRTRDNAPGCECDGKGSDICAECLTAEAFEVEHASRDFSPWEHLAHAINSGRNPDGQWEAYDAGVAAGIKAGVKARLSGRAA